MSVEQLLEKYKGRQFSSFTDRLLIMRDFKTEARKKSISEDEIENAVNEWEDDHPCSVDLKDPRLLYEFWRFVDEVVQKSSKFIGDEDCDHFGITDKVRYKKKSNTTIAFYFGLYFKTVDPSYIYIWFDNKEDLPKKHQNKIKELGMKKGKYFDSLIDNDSNPIAEYTEEEANKYNGGIWFPLKKEYFDKFCGEPGASAEEQKRILKEFFDEVTKVFDD